MSTRFKNMTIASNEVHIWHEDIYSHLMLGSKYKSLLSCEEQQRANGFSFPHLSQHYVIRRTLLRLILSQYLGTEPQNIVLTTHFKGKPCLSNPGSNLYFNLSYSRDLVYYVIATHPMIGIDIEYVREEYVCDEVAEQFLHPDEYVWFRALPFPDKLKAFYRIWTQKEAIVKAMGDGLYYPLTEINLRETPWSLLQIETTQEYLGFIAKKHDVETVKTYKYDD